MPFLTYLLWCIPVSAVPLRDESSRLGLECPRGKPSPILLPTLFWTGHLNSFANICTYYVVCCCAMLKKPSSKVQNSAKKKKKYYVIENLCIFQDCTGILNHTNSLKNVLEHSNIQITNGKLHRPCDTERSQWASLSWWGRYSLWGGVGLQ